VEMNGNSESNPVILFLHGGPGWPQTPHLRYFNSALTQRVTLVAWEQSCCGRSYLNNPEPDNLSLEQIINDAHELTQLLKQRFHKNKIYLIGFSWGSIPGMILAEKYPEDYSAYFGVTQVVNLRKSMEISRHWIAKQAALQNDQITIEQLKRIEANGLKNQAMCLYLKKRKNSTSLS
jgi:pimeloyl-ACP methyl ester carboxylesterase